MNITLSKANTLEGLIRIEKIRQERSIVPLCILSSTRCKMLKIFFPNPLKESVFRRTGLLRVSHGRCYYTAHKFLYAEYFVT